MKVLIAEDEMLERKAMRKFLEDHFPAVTITGEAVNGRMAVDLALETVPDIVLMDIKMPGIDGMEAIARIQEQLNDVRFIMVTAYDSFDYARQAMKLGVKEYILKPGKKEETIEAIQRVMDDLEKDRQKERKQNHNLKLAKQLLLSYIINETPGMKELQRDLYPRMASAFFLVIEEENQQEFFISAEELKQWTTDEVIVNQETGRQIIVLCLSDTAQVAKEPLRLLKRICLERGRQWYIGEGRPIQAEESISRSYYEALIDLQKKKGKELTSRGEIRNIMEFIREAVQEADVQKALTNTLLLLEDPEKEKHTQELFYGVKQILDTKRVEPPPFVLSGIKTEQNWYEWMQECCRRMQQHYHSLDKMERTKQWIDEHLQEAITLEEAAEYAGFSPSYFSQVFKAATGENVTDYVTRQRLQKAVALLKEQTHSLKEISFMVGYRDPNYFSRVFKKYYQLSPKQYQKNILKN